MTEKKTKAPEQGALVETIEIYNTDPARKLFLGNGQILGPGEIKTIPVEDYKKVRKTCPWLVPTEHLEPEDLPDGSSAQ